MKAVKSITVITVNYNSGVEVERTVKSILEQDSAFEWVVVDGGSTDGSQNYLLKSIRENDVFISEPDRGIADAFNKGIALSHGEALIFMNAGDEFANESSLGLLNAAWEWDRYRWIFGASEIVDIKGRVLFQRGFTHLPKDPLSLVRYNCQIVHQSVLIERSLFSECGNFNEAWRVAMDYDMWIRFITRGFAPQVVMIPVCRFHRGGASGDPLRNIREWRAIRSVYKISNLWIIDLAIELLARAKCMARGRYGLWLYRLKERLGIRI